MLRVRRFHLGVSFVIAAAMIAAWFAFANRAPQRLTATVVLNDGCGQAVANCDGYDDPSKVFTCRKVDDCYDTDVNGDPRAWCIECNELLRECTTDDACDDNDPCTTDFCFSPDQNCGITQVPVCPAGAATQGLSCFHNAIPGCNAAACGNGVVDPGEECDSGSPSDPQNGEAGKNIPMELAETQYLAITQEQAAILAGSSCLADCTVAACSDGTDTRDDGSDEDEPVNEDDAFDAADTGCVKFGMYLSGRDGEDNCCFDPGEDEADAMAGARQVLSRMMAWLQSFLIAEGGSQCGTVVGFQKGEVFSVNPLGQCADNEIFELVSSQCQCRPTVPDGGTCFYNFQCDSNYVDGEGEPSETYNPGGPAVCLKVHGADGSGPIAGRCCRTDQHTAGCPVQGDMGQYPLCASVAGAGGGAGGGGFGGAGGADGGGDAGGADGGTDGGDTGGTDGGDDNQCTQLCAAMFCPCGLSCGVNPQNAAQCGCYIPNGQSCSGGSVASFSSSGLASSQVSNASTKSGSSSSLCKETACYPSVAACEAAGGNPQYLPCMPIGTKGVACTVLGPCPASSSVASGNASAPATSASSKATSGASSSSAAPSTSGGSSSSASSTKALSSSSAACIPGTLCPNGQVCAANGTCPPSSSSFPSSVKVSCATNADCGQASPGQCSWKGSQQPQCQRTAVFPYCAGGVCQQYTTDTSCPPSSCGALSSVSSSGACIPGTLCPDGQVCPANGTCPPPKSSATSQSSRISSSLRPSSTPCVGSQCSSSRPSVTSTSSSRFSFSSSAVSVRSVSSIACNGLLCSSSSARSSAGSCVGSFCPSSSSSLLSARSSSYSSLRVQFSSTECTPGTRCPGGLPCPQIGVCPPALSSVRSSAPLLLACTGTMCAARGGMCTAQGQSCIELQSSPCMACGDTPVDTAVTCRGNECALRGGTCAARGQTCLQLPFGPCMACAPLTCDDDAQCPAGVRCVGHVCDPSVLAAANVCGNTLKEPGEECDDGNTRSYDGCNADCLLERGYCGDGTVQTLLDEQCEPAFHDRSLPFACDGRCRYLSSFCGNGLTEVGEQCDEGQGNRDVPNAACRTNCSVARCGDGIVDDLQETCDDRNRVNGDGCSDSCSDERNAPLSPLGAQVFDLMLGRLPARQDTVTLPPHAPAGETGPAAAVAVAVGASAGIAWVRRRRKGDRGNR